MQQFFFCYPLTSHYSDAKCSRVSSINSAMAGVTHLFLW